MPAHQQATTHVAGNLSSLPDMRAALAAAHPNTAFQVWVPTSFDSPALTWTDGPTPAQVRHTLGVPTPAEPAASGPALHRQETPELIAAAYLRQCPAHPDWRSAEDPFCATAPGNAADTVDAATLTGDERRAASLTTALRALYPQLPLRSALAQVVREHRHMLSVVLGTTLPIPQPRPDI